MSLLFLQCLVDPDASANLVILFPLECCEITSEWDGSPADLKASVTVSLGLSLLSGNFINGVCGLTTWATLLAAAILLPITTSQTRQLLGRKQAAVVLGSPGHHGFQPLLMYLYHFYGNIHRIENLELNWLRSMPETNNSCLVFQQHGFPAQSDSIGITGL